MLRLSAVAAVATLLALGACASDGSSDHSNDGDAAAHEGHSHEEGTVTYTCVGCSKTATLPSGAPAPS